MNEPSPDYQAIAKDIARINKDISEQNGRLELSFQLTVEDIKRLALEGLAQEQQDSIDARQAVTKELDFTAIGREVEMSDGSKQLAEAEIATHQLVIRDIQKQAELGMRISPTQAERLQQLAALKQLIHNRLSIQSPSSYANWKLAVSGIPRSAPLGQSLWFQASDVRLRSMIWSIAFRLPWR